MMIDEAAVLVIDVQMGSFDQSAPVFGSRDLRSRTSALIAQACAAGVLVECIQHCGPPGAIDQPGTMGWGIHPTVAPVAGDLLVQKHHPDAFQDAGLQSELECRGINKLVITGIQTEHCVDTTCRRAYSLGYRVTMVEDPHSTWDSDHLTASKIIEHHNVVLGGWFAELKAPERLSFAALPRWIDCRTAWIHPRG